MPVRVAIDGFTGVGRHFLLAVEAGGFDDLFEVTAIRDPAGASAIADRIRFDSIYGRFAGQVASIDGVLHIGDRTVDVLRVENSESISWEEAGVDLVVWGAGADPESAIAAGAKKVVTPGLALDGVTLMPGVNDTFYDPDQHHIVGVGTAAGNALARLATILDRSFGLSRGTYTVAHPASALRTVGDRIEGVDRRHGSALGNLIPYASMVSPELDAILPALAGRIDGTIVEVPVSPVGWLSFCVETERRLNRQEAVDRLLDAAEEDSLLGVIGAVHGRFVSSDFVADSRSVVVELDDLAMIGRSMILARAWFDAEWSLACRMADVVTLVCESGIPGTA
ncbi:ArsJ-associated glyceraldehyde-3-phosphate dehydrogenase [soil metagenome]